MAEQNRKRSRIACTSCQSRKRKCSGDQPCTTCAQFGADCHYDLLSRKKKDLRHFQPQAQSAASSLLSPATVQNDIASRRQHDPSNPAALAGLLLKALEANSGAAFARRLNPKNDIAGAPKLHLFGWNVGARYSTPEWTQALASVKLRAIVEIVSQDEMRSLAGIFFEKVDLCYPFIDRDTLLRQISRRWLPSSSEALGYGPYDAVLCGVAAFGYLFSRRQASATELQLVESARVILEQGLQSEPLSPLETVTGWVLRVAYLRMTTTAHAAWMASCSLMHLIEATSMHIEPTSNVALDRASTSTSGSCNPETRRRLFAMARHLNVWISFELGRSRVVLQGATSLPPSQHPIPPTALNGASSPPIGTKTDIFNLLPISESLDPNEAQDISTLETALSDVLTITPANAPLTLVQCNLTLCIYRRLRSLNSTISPDHLDHILSLSSGGLTAASELVAQTSPWHQVANVPFQVIVTLLAIDTRASLGMLGRAVRVLGEVAQVYDTETMREAYTTAYLMVAMHQKRKEEDLRVIKDVLTFNPSSSASTSSVLVPQGVSPTGLAAQGQTDAGAQIREAAVQSDHTLMDYPGFSWLSDILVDIPSLRDFDMDPL
ncbi:putative C6 transcription factor [Aspergillus stella-maris]|uniref:putative C6 transcription factor n=1 Tax=Aspergillus stella-maris TaxID=1810926 RepID=UPI003CCD7978